MSIQLQSYGHFYISKMAVSRHLGFYRTGNSTIRSADPENPGLEGTEHGVDRMHHLRWKLYCDLETGVLGHSRSSKAALFDRAHTSLVFRSKYASIYHRFRDVAAYWSLGVKPSYLRKNPSWRKTRVMGLSDSERISTIYSTVLIQFTRVTEWQTDRRTDRIAVAYAVARKTRKLCYRKDDRAMPPCDLYMDALKFSGLPDYAHRYYSQHFSIFHGLLFRSKLLMFVQNLKSVALSVPEIIGGTLKIWALPGYAHALFSPKFLMGFYSD